jgi:hypothetical protein
MANVTLVEVTKRPEFTFYFGKYYVNESKTLVLCNGSGTKLVGTIIYHTNESLIGGVSTFEGKDWELYKGKIIIEQ